MEIDSIDAWFGNNDNFYDMRKKIFPSGSGPH